LTLQKYFCCTICKKILNLSCLESCENITECNLNSNWKKYFRTYDIIQVPITTGYWNNAIPKIPKDKIKELEKKYIILRLDYQGIPYLLFKERDKI